MEAAPAKWADSIPSRKSADAWGCESIQLPDADSRFPGGGSKNTAEFRKDPNFGFDVPVSVPGVDSKLLDPRKAWEDADHYDQTARTLVQQFIDNFAQFEDHVDEGVRQAAPKAA